MKDKELRNYFENIFHSKALNGYMRERFDKIIDDYHNEDYHSAIESLFPLIENYLNKILQEFRKRPTSCGNLYKKLSELQKVGVISKNYKIKNQNKVRDHFLHGNWDDIDLNNIKIKFQGVIILFSNLIMESQDIFDFP